MNTGGLTELGIAQREIARAIRNLASGLDAAAPGPAGPLGGSGAPRNSVGTGAPGANLAETLFAGLRRQTRVVGGGSEAALRVGELSVDRLAGGGPLNAARISNASVSPTDGVNARVLPDASAGTGSFRDAFEPVTRAVRELTTAVGSNTGALSANTSELASGLRSVLGGFLQPDKGGGGLLSFLKGGFGIAPLTLGIAGLFGKKKDEPAPLRVFDAPASLAIEAANSEGILNGLRRTDRNQFGAVRIDSGGAKPQAAPAPQPQVIVNVSAMDSQSFMDRSADIARALRDAMLHMHPVNDVIGEI